MTVKVKVTVKGLSKSNTHYNIAGPAVSLKKLIISTLACDHL